MASGGDGLVRTSSGRLTYAPDGMVDSTNPSQHVPSVASPSSGSTVRNLSSGETNIFTDDKDGREYLDADNKEEVEGPSDRSASSSESDGGIKEEDGAIIRRLASARRSKSYTGSRNDNTLERVDTVAGMDIHDPTFDPNSDQFNLRKYLRKTLQIFDDEDIKIKRAGVLFKNVTVSGTGSALNLQSNVGSFLMAPLRIGEHLSFGHKPAKKILRNFDGLIKGGELLIVLGRPGSGCSTLLKTITGEMHGLDLDKESTVHYNGISQRQMMKEFKGEVIYNQEVDKHFPHLTVGETLEHAAACRIPNRRALNTSRQNLVEHLTQVVMAVYGLSHTYNTKVGDDFVRGVSGGERKRVSIAEMALSGSPMAAWDNSTRGLDSASALTFTQSLRQTASLIGSAHAVAIYQASQAIYDLFDKAVVLYEGRQIYFGPASRARDYFERMGWVCPQRQTTGDFLTSVTNPAERQAKEGFEDRVPKTPDDFEAYWRASPEYQELQKALDEYEEEFPAGSEGALTALRANKADQQAKHVRSKSSFVISIPMQIKLNTHRAARRIWNDKASTFTPLLSNCIMALIIGSVFFGTPDATVGFQAYGAALFFAILLNALTAISEINSLYAQRPIVEKHKSYAFYHPATEAMAGIVLDIPLKFAQAVVFNIVLYFLVGLRTEPSQFFIFFLICYITTFIMSALFRTMAALTKTISQAMSLAGVLILAIVIYTGFVVPIPYMKVWFSWIRYSKYWSMHGRESTSLTIRSQSCLLRFRDSSRQPIPRTPVHLLAVHPWICNPSRRLVHLQLQRRCRRTKDCQWRQLHCRQLLVHLRTRLAKLWHSYRLPDRFHDHVLRGYRAQLFDKLDCRGPRLQKRSCPKVSARRRQEKGQ